MTTSALARPASAPPASRAGVTVDRPYQALHGLVGLAGMLGCFAIATAIAYNSAGFGPRGEFLVYGSWMMLGAIPVLMLTGFMIGTGMTTLQPRQALVLTFFGNYHGTFAKPGFWWINPFTDATKIPLATSAKETKPITVNDLMGNPITIAAMVSWRVDEAARAHFDVADYRGFVTLQAEAALRHVASIHPYDRAEVEVAKATADASAASEVVPAQAEHVTALRSDRDAINAELIQELSERTRVAGIVIEEVRLTHLAYAAEIAGAMLKRQQAQAIVDARRIMVQGSVGIVRDTIKELTEGSTAEDRIPFDAERKVQFAANLLIMIVGDREASPVLNVGTMNP